MNTRPIPRVVGDQFVAPDQTKIRVGSRAWFKWLQEPTTRSFAYQSTRAEAAIHLTLRREQKRNGEYWYAYRTHHGKLRKAYAGKSEELTPERLGAVTDALWNENKNDARVQLEFFGVPRVVSGMGPLALNPKAIAMLAYLAARSEPIAREKILTLLWQESAPEAARKNLRNLLWHLRTHAAPGLVQGAQEIFLDAKVRCDVCAFQNAERELTHSSNSLRSLQTLRKLYRGEFLEGFALNDAPEFEIWLTGAREHFHEAYLDALQKLSQVYRARDKWKAVSEIAHAAIEQDVLQEPMYRALMEAHARLGDRAAALRHYDTLRETLERELGVEPLPETQELRAAIVSGAITQKQRPVSDRRVTYVFQRPSPFVGRAHEIELFNETWREAQQGGARVVLLAGEAGIGKSRLWERWAASLAENVLVWNARCLMSTSALPFAPLIELLRAPTLCERFLALGKTTPPSWLADVSRLTPELRELMPQLAPPPSLPAIEEQRHLFESLVMALGIGEARATVLFIDDLHWADRSTLDWLGYVLFRAREMPFLFVGAYRPADAAPPLVNLIAQWSREGITTRLNLVRLDHEESAALIQALQGDLTRAETLFAQSAGNPYFLIELLRAAPDTIPTALADLIESRVQRLDAAARQILQAASVLQADITFPVLQFTAGRTDDEVLDGIDGLRDAGLLNEQNARYELSHPLIAVVVERALNSARRARLHRRAAEAIERAHASNLAESAGRLTRHYAEAGEDPRAAYFAELAAERALQLAAPNEAIQFYERALALEPTPAREFGLGNALHRAGNFVEARKHYERALSEFEAKRERVGAARACMGLARTFLSTGQAGQVIAWIQRGRAYIDRDQDPATQAMFEYLMGTELRAVGTELEQAEAHFSVALELAERSEAQTLIGDILMELGNTRAQRGNLRGAIECYRAMIAHGEMRNEQNLLVVGYNNLAYHLLLAGEIEQAKSAIEKALELAGTLDIQSARQWLYSTRGEVALAQEEWDIARAWFEHGIVFAERYGNREQMTNYEMNLALAARGSQQSDEAVLLLENARAHAQTGHTRFLQAQIELWLTQVYLERGELTAARAALERADTHLRGSRFEALHEWAERLRESIVQKID